MDDEAVRGDTTQVLVVDDQESIREGCRQILAGRGIHVRTAPDGIKGLGLAEELRPPVVLVDLKMPGMGGHEVLRGIREADERIVAVVITAFGTTDSAVEAMKAGAFDFICKPFDDEALIHTVDAAMSEFARRNRAADVEREEQVVRDNFAAMVCHELKTPAAAAFQWVDVVKSGLAGPLTPGQQDALSKAHRRLTHLAEMIGDWLTLARIEQGCANQEFGEVDIEAVVRRSWDAVRDEEGWGRTEFRVETDGPAGPVWGSAQLLGELFCNLFANSLKFSSGPGRITVTVGRRARRLEVRVRDTGMGVPEDEIPHLFERFYRGSRSDVRRKKGSGLGLAIVKTIADLHHAAIAVSSKITQGTEFVITFAAGRGAFRDGALAPAGNSGEKE